MALSEIILTLVVRNVFKVNEYFDGKVKSISFTETAGAATIGVLAQGEYEFNTGKSEIMHIVSGQVSVALPDESAWREIKAGEKFNVAANSKFKIKVLVESAYLCQYR